MAASIIREMANLSDKETLKCITSSFQIKIEAERSGLELVHESKIPQIDVIFDGADEVDTKFNMIKGGGTFRCEACGTSFSSQQELEQHSRQEHGK